MGDAQAEVFSGRIALGGYMANYEDYTPEDTGTEGVRAVFSITSKHFGTKDEYNESNYGFGIEYPHTRNWYSMGGVYRNSEDSASVYAGVGYMIGGKWVKVGIEAGAVTGYDKAPVLPLVVPTLRLADHVKLLYIPKYGTSPHVLGLQLVW